MAKYYYRFKAYTKVGKKFRQFWNECIKADEAAEKYAAKVGASRSTRSQTRSCGAPLVPIRTTSSSGSPAVSVARV